MPAKMNDAQRELLAAARQALAAADAAQRALAAGGVDPEQLRLYDAVGGELADVVFELTEILESHAGIVVHDDKRPIPRSKPSSVVLPVTLAGDNTFAYVCGPKRIKITIAIDDDPPAESVETLSDAEIAATLGNEPAGLPDPQE
jgi:hypothetical protein